MRPVSLHIWSFNFTAFAQSLVFLTGCSKLESTLVNLNGFLLSISQLRELITGNHFGYLAAFLFCGSDSLDHNRNTFSTAIKISDTAEKYTSQYTVGRETFQVSGTLRDYLGIIGKGRG